jgi:hypothetical protein
MVLSLAVESGAKDQAMRTLNFPADRTMGNLNLLGAFAPYNEGYADIRPPLGKARGAVKAPATAKVRLQLSYDAGEDAAPLLKVNCPALVSIDCRNVESVNDKTVQVLSQMKDLEEIKLNNASITDKALEYLTALPKLVSLDVMRTDITNQGIPYLWRMHQLKVLSLGFNVVSDQEMEKIDQLPNLEYLNVSRCGLSDEALKYVARLKHLDRLDIADNKKITDKGVEYLTACPNLSTIMMQSTGIDRNVVKSLKRIKKLKYIIIGLSAADTKYLQGELKGCNVSKYHFAGQVSPEFFAPLH